MEETISSASMIDSEHWPSPIDASADVIRASLYCGEWIDFYRFRITRPDRWELWAIHKPKKGWSMQAGTVQPRIWLSAVTIGSKYARRRLRSSMPWRLLNRFEFFDRDVVERVAAEFLGGASPPTSVAWAEFSR